MGVKETPGKRCCYRRRHRLSRKRARDWPDPIFKRLCVPAQNRSRGVFKEEEKKMTEDRNQTLADALEELGFRGHVPNQWVPMVAEVRRAPPLFYVPVSRSSVLDFGFLYRSDVWRDESFFEREEAKERERRTSRGARKIFHDGGRNREFSSLHNVLY